MPIQKASNLEQVKQFAIRSKSEAEKAAKAAAAEVIVPTRVSQLTNDSKFQTEAQVNTSINAKLSSTYKPGGSVAFASLPAANAEHLGMVYNITNAFTTTASFMEGAGKSYPAGTNVVVVANESSFRYDALAGFVDLSGYVTKENGKGLSSNDFTDADKTKLDNINFASDEEFNAMLDEVYGTTTAEA